MIGDSFDAPGGMATVARVYRQAGLFTRHRIVYIANYVSPGLWSQIRTVGKGLLCFIKLGAPRKSRIAHIHSAARGSFWRAALFAEFARLLGMPYLLHIHSGEFDSFYEQECGRLAKRIVKRTLRSAAGVICLTQGWHSRLSLIEPTARFIVLPNPVLLPDTLPASPVKTCTALFLGKVSEKKGVMDLLNAMPQVLAQLPEARLQLAGNGELDAALQTAKQLGIEDSVQFLGWIDGASKEDILQAASIVVLPSHFEAFGLAIVEGMIHAKPVVATKVGGIPEVLIDGQHGILIPPSDPDALAEALTKLLSDSALREQMGNAGRSFAINNYGATSVVGKLSSYYDEIIGSRRKSHSSKEDVR